MGKIPVSRATTYVPGITEVKSADLNGIQDVFSGDLVHFKDEFFCMSDAWEVTADGIGAVTPPSGGNDWHNLNVVSGNVSSDITTLRSRTALCTAEQLPGFRARVRYGKGATPVTSQETYVGLVKTSSSPSAVAPILAFFRNTSAATNPNNIKLQVLGGAVVEQVDTGIAPVVDTWYTLQAICVTQDQVDWAVLDAEGAVLASGSFEPTDPIDDTDTAFFNVQIKSLSAAQRSFAIDHVSCLAGRPAD